MIKRFYIKGLYLLLVVICAVSAILGGINLNVSAASESGLNFDKTNVFDDLKESIIDDTKFDLNIFNFDEKKSLQLLSFVEYGYSFYGNLQGNYGLYVYLYNPQGLKFDQDSSMHRITLAFGNNQSQKFISFPLVFLNASEESDFKGLFYKFKVNISSAQKETILKTLNSTSRIYRIGEIELKKKNDINATSYSVGETYNVSGYAKGYGADEKAESTLKISRGDKQEVISLKINSTFYRPTGNNGKNEFIQDSLHSVYFAVPNYYIETYGEMSAVHATWLNAVLKPMLVTGNQDAFEVISDYVGKIPDFDKLKYIYASGFFVDKEARPGGHHVSVEKFKGYSYNNADYSIKSYGGSDLGVLYGIFNSGSAINSADSYIVQSSEIKTWLKSTKTLFGGELVNEKYSKAVFEQVDDVFTDMNVRRDEKKPLTSIKVTEPDWWGKLWGKKATEEDQSEAFKDIASIYSIDYSKDLTGTKSDVANRLFIYEDDYSDFINFCNSSQKDDKTVYLFRYQVSDYYSREASLIEHSTAALGVKSFKEIDTNAYFFQETVNLDFDIIDLTFTKDSKDTVIPVAASPVDIVPEGTPPIKTTPDKPALSDLIKKIVMLVLIVVLLVILSPVLPYIVKAVIWVITLPFKLIENIIAAIKKK